MRIESSITSVSWIPSEAVEGMFKMPFQLGLARYDEPLPDVLKDIDAWGKADPQLEWYPPRYLPL